jgi:hypothetical protein
MLVAVFNVRDTRLSGRRADKMLGICGPRSLILRWRAVVQGL